MTPAVRRSSPVIIATSSPISRSLATASRDSLLTVSATATSPRAPRPQRIHASCLTRELLTRRAERVLAGLRPGQEPPAPDADSAALHQGFHAAAARGAELLGLCEGRDPILRAPHDGLAQRVLAGPFGRSGEAQDLVFAEAVGGDHLCQLGLALVRVPVLSRTTVVSLWAASRASPPLMRMPDSAPLPVPTIIEVGVASPIAHGQAMIRTATKLRSASRLGAEDEPHYERESRDRRHHRHEDAADPVRQPLYGRLGALRSSTILIICCRAVSFPTFVASNLNEPVVFMVAPITPSPTLSYNRHGLAGDHGLVHRRLARDHHAIDRHLLPGPDHHDVPYRYVLDRHIALFAVTHHPRRLRPEAGELLWPRSCGPWRAPRAAFRAGSG